MRNKEQISIFRKKNPTETLKQINEKTLHLLLSNTIDQFYM